MAKKSNDTLLLIGLGIAAYMLYNSSEKQAANIGDASARLSFKNNEEMVNFFRQEQIKKFEPKYGFSKN